MDAQLGALIAGSTSVDVAGRQKLKVLAVLIILVALVIMIVPQFTNCEANKDDAATSMSSPGTTTMASSALPSSSQMASAAPMASPTAAATPYRMMKCYWTAHAEIVAGVPLIAIGALLLFARRKETTRVLGILTAILGVLTILLPTSIIGTCVNDQMVCNVQMKPVLLISGGIIVALGAAVVAFGEMRRDNGGGAATPA